MDQGKKIKQSAERLAFTSAIVDRIRAADNVLNLPGGQILLPKVFGFCRGVERALAMLDQAVTEHSRRGQRLFLLGQIIHNPWVNDYFESRGVRVLGQQEITNLEQIITAADCAIIPAFGVSLPVEKRLQKIGCETVDTSCGDVRRLWNWAQRAAGEGYGILIFGRADHDETVVTKSRLEACNGKYVVAGKLEQVDQFCRLMSGELPPEKFREIFDAQTTNADDLSPFERLAQVSQTTMLYDETMTVRQRVTDAFVKRFGQIAVSERLLFQPPVCRATQARQAAAVELCRDRLDLAIVVGGFGSSNTRHLYELARNFAPAYFIESAAAIRSSTELDTADPTKNQPRIVKDWLGQRRPVRIGVLAGASSPEVVMGEVLEKLASYLA
jgi:4-hydroxy-3-methylbut-2-enyl diphosphate reductase